MHSRILVHLASADLAGLWRTFLRRKGVEAVVGQSGEDLAAHFIRLKGAVDLILLDVGIGRANVTLITRQIRESSARMGIRLAPMIALSQNPRLNFCQSHPMGADALRVFPGSSGQLMRILAEFSAMP